MKRLWYFSEEKSSRDPAVIYHNGKYYACFAGKNDSIGVCSSRAPEGLAEAEVKTVFKAPLGTEYSKQLWAPELHVIDGKCYIYVACDNGNNHTHRMYVLGNDSGDPEKEYHMLGKICDGTDKWAIDGTVITCGGKSYFVWSGWEGDTNVCQNLYISAMKSPTELEGERYLISSPEHEWEKLGATGEEESPFINEGPFGVWLDGELYLLYSGAGSWCEDYCIAYLKYLGGDPTSIASWQKCKKPILSKNDELKGAGHPSVIQKDGENLIFFHAWSRDEQNVVWNRVYAYIARLYKKDGELIIE
jgi:GH43 family beta-xylosidase